MKKDPNAMEYDEYCTQAGELAGRLAEALKREGWFAATAESCTGGLAAAALTSLAGSSEWFRGGVVAYDNTVKTTLLGVPEAILQTHGAVSQEVVLRMALGVCDLLGARAALAVSGIAGPGGGTRQKPVGTVCIAVAAQGAVAAQTFLFTGDRESVRRQSVLMALAMLVERVGQASSEG
jgi:PncC family amidohydrolase